MHWQVASLLLSHLGSRLYDHTSAIMRKFCQVISMAFSKPVDWNRIQACTQKSDNPIHDYYNQLQIVLKENSTLLSDVDSTWVSINPCLLLKHKLNWVLSFLVKRTRTEWETISSIFSSSGNPAHSDSRWITEKEDYLQTTH